MNISKLKPKGGKHAVSVLVAVGRDGLFASMALPSILAALPTEVIVAEGEGTASQKWNACAKRATNDVCFVCADDFFLNPRAMEWIEGAMKHSPDAAIAYGDHIEVNSPMTGVFIRRHECKRWDVAKLMDGNHIGAYAFRKSTTGVPLDESLTRYEDWDLMLRMHNEGRYGVQINEVLAVALFTDSGISVPEGEAEAREVVLSKYRRAQ